MAQKNAENPQNSPITADKRVAEGVEVTFYTDPLCCWSWAMEPQWRQLQEKFAGSLSVTYKMAGLLPSWNNFTDTLNSIHKPAHMGPEWMHAREISGVNIDPGIWVVDPPASSFPPCIAVKCAEFQSKEAADQYLYLLRENVMVKNRNIARTDVLLEIACEVSLRLPSFDLFIFRDNLFGDGGKDAFRKDWQEAKYKGITRLPTLVFRSAGHTPILLSGFQTYDLLEKAVLTLNPMC